MRGELVTMQLVEISCFYRELELSSSFHWRIFIFVEIGL